jgi:hypothetical protein
MGLVNLIAQRSSSLAFASASVDGRCTCRVASDLFLKGVGLQTSGIWVDSVLKTTPYRDLSVRSLSGSLDRNSSPLQGYAKDAFYQLVQWDGRN